ncbi:hypothetical protein H8356DRAFT_1285146 [Neocallimastix lanati (nom. inval.)]|nr:hypothetical protein H8356DRAFT_1285146 [Neocallimastix sp. JGI-2020a]
MQNSKENSPKKNRKTSRSNNKKQNDESFKEFLNSDIPNPLGSTNSFMAVNAIGVRMAKLQNKLRYNNALAPALRNLPDYCPSNPTYSINIENNKNNNQKYELNKKLSTLSSDKQIIFENYNGKSLNNTNNSKNNKIKIKLVVEKGKVIVLKKLQRNLKKSSSSESLASTNNENQTNEEKEIKENNSKVKSKTVVLTKFNEKIDIVKNENEKNSKNVMNIIKDDSTTITSFIDSKVVTGLPEQTIMNYISRSFSGNKESNKESIQIKKEINHKKINISSDNNLIKNATNNETNMSNQVINSSKSLNSNSINKPFQISTIRNSISNNNILISPVLYNKGAAVLSNNIYNVNINNSNPPNSLSCTGEIYNNINTNSPTNTINDILNNEIYLKNSQLPQQIKSQSTPLQQSGITYLSKNVIGSQSYSQGFNYKLKENFIKVKSQQPSQLLLEEIPSINSTLSSSQNAINIEEQIIKIHQQRQQQKQQKQQQLQTAQQQHYYTKAKTSSFPDINNHSNIVQNISPSEVNINSTLINPINNTVNSSKSTMYNQKQYSKSTVLNNLVDISMNNNSALTMNTFNYISSSSPSLQTLNLNTTNINTNVNNVNINTLISPVLTNQTILYPTTVVHSPNENSVTTTIMNSTPSTGNNNELIYDSVIDSQNKEIKEFSAISSNMKIEEVNKSLSEMDNSSLKENNEINQISNISYNNIFVNNDSSCNNNLIITKKDFVKIPEDEVNNNTIINRNMLSLSGNSFETIKESLSLTNSIENSQYINDETNNLNEVNSSLVARTLCEDNTNILEVPNSILLAEKTLKMDEGSSNSTIVNQGNELNSNLDINLSMVDNEKIISNDLTIYSSSTSSSYKDTLSSLYTPSLRPRENFNENSSIFYENITPPFSTKVSPVILSKSELSSDELTNSLNKIKDNSIKECVNSPYIVSSVPSNSNMSIIEDDKEIINKNNYSITLGDNNELIQSGNLNGISTTAPTPLNLVNINNLSKNESTIGISPIITHPAIFKQNRNELYNIPLNMNCVSFTSASPPIASPPYKSTVNLPLTPISSRSISSSHF